MLIDSVIFNDELDLLEGRLEYLNDVVDVFVVVEMDITHSGKSKHMNFANNVGKFRKYMHKIIYIPFSPEKEKYDFSIKPEKTDFESSQWKVENDHRNQILMGLRFFDPEAFVMISDVDEIPMKSAIKVAVENLNPQRTAIAFEQEMFYYNFKQRQVNNWSGTVITKNSECFKQGPQSFRNARFNLPKLTKAGYHLSYWNTADKIKEKIESFAHQEYNTEKFTDIEYIKEQMKRGEDIFGREENPFMKVERDSIDKEFLEIFEKYEKGLP
jgi:beta-1,4-mannosyl-glycoprotein beta-1,4-N-acetylglucosaminyltransferase